MPASKTQQIRDLLDRWQFAGAVLLMEASRIHEVRGCCRFDVTPPTLCLGLGALDASIKKLARETEALVE